MSARNKDPKPPRFSKNAFESPETVYIKGCVRQWLARLAALGCRLDRHFFACFAWATGDARRALLLLAETAKQDLPKQYRSINIKVRQYLEEDTHSFRVEESILENFPPLQPFVREKIVAACSAEASLSRTENNDFALARRRLRRLFGLGRLAVNLAEYVFINQHFKPVEEFFEDECHVWKAENRHLLACMLGSTEVELSRAFVELHSAWLINAREMHGCWRLHESVVPLWYKGGEADELFCRPVRGRAMPLENFRLRPEDMAHALALLRNKSDRPVHILLYGQSGTGKTSFARSLVRVCGSKAWAVSSRLHDDDNKRRCSLMACLSMNSRNPGSLVVADEAERLLDTAMRPGFPNKDKAWLNDLLERPGRRVIWISNQVEHLDPAVLRRFSLSLHFDGLRPRERLALWRQIAADLRVTAYLPEAVLERLARDHDAPAAVISEAVRQAKNLYRNKADFLLAIERVLRSHAALQNQGRLSPPKTQAAPDFSLRGINLDGPEGSAEALLEACRRADALLKAPAGIVPGAATMLFYGPPGTGKTALARHIAREIGRECLVKRAGDLLDPYVGMTERRIAQAFYAAETQGEVLIIDEVDSFLSARSTLKYSWETTMVNAFLTSLEECRSFCICTTNSREQLDAAAMRRFAHKIAFGYANREQAAALYGALLAPLAGSPLPAEGERELSRLDRLTPGDFQVVRASCQSLFAGRSSLTHKDILAALRREVALKLEKNDRAIGFALSGIGNEIHATTCAGAF